jgi:hypothetical protein
MITGSCACGGIRFEIDQVRSLTHCHCAICRKLTAAAFASYAHVAREHFRLVAGQDLMTQYESAPNSFRNFCKVCGSLVPGQAPYLKTISVPAGLLDDDPGVRPSLHVFVDSKASWVCINDELPRYVKWVPGYEPAAAGDRAGA